MREELLVYETKKKDSLVSLCGQKWITATLNSVRGKITYRERLSGVKRGGDGEEEMG